MYKLVNKHREGSLGKRYIKLVKNMVNKTQEQVTKFRRLRNFATYEILQVAKFLQPCKIPVVF